MKQGKEREELRDRCEQEKRGYSAKVVALEKELEEKVPPLLFVILFFMLFPWLSPPQFPNVSSFASFPLSLAPPIKKRQVLETTAAARKERERDEREKEEKRIHQEKQMDKENNKISSLRALAELAKACVSTSLAAITGPGLCAGVCEGDGEGVRGGELGALFASRLYPVLQVRAPPHPFLVFVPCFPQVSVNLCFLFLYIF